MDKKIKLGFLEYFDVVGHHFTFNIGKSENLKTKAGGVITILFALSLIIPTYYFGRDISFREEPQFITESEMLPDYPFFNATNSLFFFAYRLIDINLQNIDNQRYFEYLFDYEEFTFNNITHLH